MPRRKQKPEQKSEQSNGESVGGYFRRIFAERPELLGERSNDELLARWLQDHPQHKQVPVNVKNNLANVKSVLRKKGRKRRGRKARAGGGGAEAQTVAATSSARTQSTRLERLEEHIDEALTQARILDRAGLERIIQLLRRARNEVVWMIGQ